MTLGEFRRRTENYSDNAEIKLSIDLQTYKPDSNHQVDARDLSTYIRPARGGDIEWVCLKN